MFPFHIFVRTKIYLIYLFPIILLIYFQLHLKHLFSLSIKCFAHDMGARLNSSLSEEDYYKFTETSNLRPLFLL